MLTDAVTLSNENIELTGWKQKASDQAPFIEDDFVFTPDSDIYASTQIASFKTKGNGTITGYEGLLPPSLFLPKLAPKE